MAIKKSLSKDQTEIRLAVVDAYIKIHNIEIRLQKIDTVRINILVYADKDARMDPDAASINKEIMEINMDDFIKIGNPKSFNRDDIFNAAYRVLKEKGYNGEDV